MKPFEFQRECLDELRCFNGRALMSLDMGLGKTAISLWWMLRNPDRVPVVVVCPACVKYQWESEARRLVQGLRAVFVCEGRASSRIPARTDLVIINYDLLAPRTDKRMREVPMDWLREVTRIKPEMVILDEVQYISNESNRTEAARELCYGVPQVLALSGTPLLNRPINLWNTLNILQPDLFRSRFKFGLRYCGAVRNEWTGGWDFKGATRLDELHEVLLDNVMIRRRKRDVLKDLPDKIRRVITLPIKKRSEYIRARNEFIQWLKEKSPAKAKRAMRSEGVTKIGYLLRLASELKLEFVIDWIDEFLEDTDEKLVVFANQVKTIEYLHQKTRAKSDFIYGATSKKKRKGIVEKFKKDPSFRLLIGNTQAMGTGLDGLQVASNAAFVELPWQPGSAMQAEDRIYRIGTRKDVWIWYLVAKDTIEVSVCRLLQKKQEVLSGVLDGGMKRGDFDVYDKLVNEMGRMV
jgi:SWI/SNF-related matrix-associated actin-dependent regulator 1 of chromatin subfamily A